MFRLDLWRQSSLIFVYFVFFRVFAPTLLLTICAEFTALLCIGKFILWVWVFGWKHCKIFKSESCNKYIYNFPLLSVACFRLSFSVFFRVPFESHLRCLFSGYSRFLLVSLSYDLRGRVFFRG